jgi:hypothetical protein
MITRLDQQIEQLEDMVEKCLILCNATWNGVRCTLPANHERTKPYKFPIEFLQTPNAQGIGKPLHTTRIGSNRSESRITKTRRLLGLFVDAPHTPHMAVPGPGLVLEATVNCYYGGDNPEFERLLQLLVKP